MIGAYPRGAYPHGSTGYPLADTLLAATPGAVFSPPFFVLEMQTYLPGTATQASDFGHGSRPHGTVAKLSQALEATSQINVSDVGFVGNGAVYPPKLDTAFSVDLETSLDPHTATGGYQFGSIVLINADRSYDGVAAAQNNDGRPVRMLMGQKVYDASRGLLVDPPYASLQAVWGGIGQPWSIDDVSLTCPVRDPTYWIEGPVQSALYGGTGGYDGNAALVGQPLPKTRGGTSGAPVCNVSPVQVDPVNLIYQYTDGPGTITTLYEGGDGANITRDGEVPDLYSAPPPAPGHYRTCNARGCFQLGSKPVQAITADATGAFPAAGAVTYILDLVRYLLTEDMGLPISLLDMGAFIGVGARWPYPAGVFIAGQTPADGATTVAAVLASIGAQLVPTASGQLRPFVLRAPLGLSAVAALDTSNVLTVTPVALPTGVFPPTYRWRVGYNTNYTVQTSGLLPNATAAHVQAIAQTGATATWIDLTVKAAYRRPTDPAILPSALLAQGYAQDVANDLGALWGVRRRTYDVVVPLLAGVGRQIGDAVTLSWPMDDLGAGKIAQVVGISFRSYDASITLRVLV